MPSRRTLVGWGSFRARISARICSIGSRRVLHRLSSETSSPPAESESPGASRLDVDLNLVRVHPTRPVSDAEPRHVCPWALVLMRRVRRPGLHEEAAAFEVPCVRKALCTRTSSGVRPIEDHFVTDAD